MEVPKIHEIYKIYSSWKKGALQYFVSGNI